MSDLISRQDAIDAVKEYFKFSPLEGRQCAKAIERVPSAQPEHLVKESGDLVKDLVKDCISRQDAIEVAKKHWYKPDIAGALAELPSTQPERQTGHWIDTGATPFTNNEGQLIHEKICSKCKSIAYFRSVCGIMIANNVCPNCGADMRGET